MNPLTDIFPPSDTNGLHDDTPWLAVRLFTLRQQEAKALFEENGIETFVPMQYADVEDGRGRVHHVLKPVVRNLLFVKKPHDIALLAQLSASPELKMSVVRSYPRSNKYSEIPAREMREFMLMCHPSIELRQFLNEEEAHFKAGVAVEVRYGPLRGLHGKLVRRSGKYYLLKEISGLGVMVKVSRWCCKALH